MQLIEGRNKIMNLDPHLTIRVPSARIFSRMAVLVWCGALFLPSGFAAEPDLPMRMLRNDMPPAASAGSRLGEFQKLVASEPSLVGYWPLADSLDAAIGGPSLQHGNGKSLFRGAPLGLGSSIDLAQGAYLSLPPSEELDAAELSVELIFNIKYLKSGTLFGIRDGADTRFSLHYTAEERTLKLWNGSEIIGFDALSTLKMGDWLHVTLAISDTESILWINGKRCAPSSSAGMNASLNGLPFLVGTTDLATGTTERGDILASHLAIYQTKLTDEAVAARIKALGWEDKLVSRPQLTSAEEIARIDQRVARIKEQHGVDVHYKYVHETFIPAVWHSVGEGTQLPYEYVPKVLDEIEAFLAVVPKAVSEKELDGIYLFDVLKIGGNGMGGMAYGKSIYLCCIRPLVEIRYTLYHELGHILKVAYPFDDEVWAELLPEDFAYGQNSSSNPLGYDDSLRSDGFVINYSTLNRHEDFAVLSDYIFVRKAYTLDLMESYPAIKRKVAAIVKYYQKISPEYDFAFYDAVIDGMDPPPVDIFRKP